LAPTIRIAPPTDPGPLRDAVTHLDCYDWILFTSGNTVDAVFSSFGEAGLDVRALAGAKVCAIGVKTREALRSRGIHADLIPEDARAEGVIAALRPLLTDRTRILLPRAETARELLPESLRDAGAEVDVVAAYQNLPPEPKEVERIRSLVDPAEGDAILFTSASTVQNLFDVLGQDAAKRLNALDLFSIGPITTQAAERLGLHVADTSPDPTIESLVATLRAYYAPPGDADA
jgi:uroporphyrinogen III methyltransferase/synthase